MPKGIGYTSGASGLKPGGQMEKDVIALSDAAKRAKRAKLEKTAKSKLKKTFEDKKPKPKVRWSTARKIQKLQVRAANFRADAFRVENKDAKAATAFRKKADAILAEVKTLRAKPKRKK